LDITSSQSQISLNTGKNTSFRTDITTISTSVDFPSKKYPYIKRTESKNNTYILGTSGIEDDPKSLIKIRATGGSLTIK